MEQVSVVNLEGEIDQHLGDELLKNIVSLSKSETNGIILDFSHVEHIHYRVLSELVTVAKACDLQPGDIKLVNLNPYTREIVRASGTDSYFEMYNSVEDAVMSFSHTADGSTWIH
ncbi:MAG: STAS domain-containing protein [Deltaproteobacteria bacterium]|nr:MAG: STAS domain-containing protein [Deltaproteobacteria bacterium]